MKNKVWFMALGGLLALVLVFGVAATFAQIGGDDATSEETQPEETQPANPDDGFRGRGNGIDDQALLADALGITVEELTAAFAAAHTAAVEAAVDAGLITQEQADQILSGNGRFHRNPRFFGEEIDIESLLADALGITVDELQTAREAAQAARLAEMVDAGLITQEQADMIVARQAVRDYYDADGVAEMLQQAYETAVQEALDAGVITQEQADQLIENYEVRVPFSGGPGGHGRGGRGGHGRGGHGPGAGFPTP